MPRLLLLALLTTAASAQSLQLFTEFQRPGPYGQVLAIDRSPSPREIVSPATPRNGYVSFHIAVSVPPGQTYFLYTQANPPGIIRMILYKEQFVEGIPDALTPVNSPAFGVIPDAQSGIPDQTSRNYLLDVWTPANAEVNRRVRIEVLLKYGTWYVTPFELRIMDATVTPPAKATPAPLPDLHAPADAAALQALANPQEWNPIQAPQTVREVLRRNAQQDMALAAQQATPLIWLRTAAQIANTWTLFPTGSEWYLRIRDLLYSRPTQHASP